MKVVSLLYFVTMAFSGLSQERLLSSLLQTVPAVKYEIIQTQLSDFVCKQKLNRERYKTDTRFLKSLVKESHQRFLKKYRSYAQFYEPFESGNYDCLSGTSFFSLVLEQLGFRFQIIETTYHIFLIIQTQQGEVLLETTDRVSGFKTNPEDIKNTLALYRNQSLTIKGNKELCLLPPVQVFTEINSMQLSGLLFFNQAVIAYHQQEWLTCANRLELAKYLYNNPRVDFLSHVLIHTIPLSDLTVAIKNRVTSNIKNYLTSPSTLDIR